MNVHSWCGQISATIREDRVSRVTPEQFQSRRDCIISAATAVFARKGCALATMQDVAAEAGLSVGALYRYFPGKDDLIAAVFQGIGLRTSSLFARAALDAGSPGDMLRHAGLILAQRFEEEVTRDETILVLEGILADSRSSTESVGSGRQLRDVYVFLTERLFQQAQDEGVLDPAINIRGLASLFVSLMVGIHILRLEFGEALEMRPLLDAVDEMLLRMAPAECDADARDLTAADDDDLAVPIGGRE
jgi:AcrR family transcriptional regulator